MTRWTAHTGAFSYTVRFLGDFRLDLNFRKEQFSAAYVRALGWVMQRRLAVVVGAAGLLVVVLLGLGSQLRREFFPEVDAGAFEIQVRARSGTRTRSRARSIRSIYGR